MKNASQSTTNRKSKPFFDDDQGNLEMGNENAPPDDSGFISDEMYNERIVNESSLMEDDQDYYEEECKDQIDLNDIVPAKKTQR